VHKRVCEDVRVWLEGFGWAVVGIATSPITGPEGNIEFLIGAVKRDMERMPTQTAFQQRHNEQTDGTKPHG